MGWLGWLLLRPDSLSYFLSFSTSSGFGGCLVCVDYGCLLYLY